MNAVSPVKKRAVLASLDANTMSPSHRAAQQSGDAKHGSSPVKSAAALRKRVLDAAATAAAGNDAAAEDAGSSWAKRLCVEKDRGYQIERRHEPSQSPDTTGSVSSVFDSSAGDASWATTTTTDVDVERLGGASTLPTPARSRSMTREQAREKAQILRLRLGLASYKVRTGQTNVPLADLQVMPLPPARSSSFSTDDASKDVAQHERSKSVTASERVAQEMGEEGDKTDNASQQQQQQQEDEEEKKNPASSQAREDRGRLVEGGMNTLRANAVAAAAAALRERVSGDDACSAVGATKGGATSGMLGLLS